MSRLNKVFRDLNSDDGDYIYLMNFTDMEFKHPSHRGVLFVPKHKSIDLFIHALGSINSRLNFEMTYTHQSTTSIQVAFRNADEARLFFEIIEEEMHATAARNPFFQGEKTHEKVYLTESDIQMLAREMKASGMDIDIDELRRLHGRPESYASQQAWTGEQRAVSRLDDLRARYGKNREDDHERDRQADHDVFGHRMT